MVWEAPEEGVVKIITDAAFQVDSGTGAGAVVIRDHSGEVLVAEARWCEHLPDVLAAEALAARDGLRAASFKGYREG
ncbi:hypothetical protein BAE44_0025230 [Dichanthelium oligosanthes]|uniref:RNase H type-1 domain-containing protein n=1 Tax=Dichanthelium oligosanthes TaxID=888268 RepID=A0A1E5ULJ9_9POAL|nr:hypothetical protein BAE44_0025230 [Dichanthelium oligosanthes]